MVHLVISSFNTDPAYLLALSRSFIIYDQSSDKKIKAGLIESSVKRGWDVRFTENLGHNLNNILDFIIDNYYQLKQQSNVLVLITLSSV